MSLKLVPASPPLYEEATSEGPLRSCEIAVINCAMANGFSSTMLFSAGARDDIEACLGASSNPKSNSASSSTSIIVTGSMAFDRCKPFGRSIGDRTTVSL
jgi:hypothetical protein